MGKLQRRILGCLAHSLDRHIQGIQKDLSVRDYKSVHTAVNRLAQYELLESHEGTSEKKLKIDLWRLSEAGVFYVIASDIPNIDFAKLFENYGQASRLTRMVSHVAQRMGKEEFTRFVKTAAEIYLSIRKAPKTRRLKPKNLLLAVVGAIQGWAQTEYSQDAFSKIAETLLSDKDLSKMAFAISPYSLEVYPIGLLRLTIYVRRPLIDWERMKHRFAEKLYQNNWQLAKTVLENAFKEKRQAEYRLSCSQRIQTQNGERKCVIGDECTYRESLLCPKVKRSIQNFLKS